MLITSKFNWLVYNKICPIDCSFLFAGVRNANFKLILANRYSRANFLFFFVNFLESFKYFWWFYLHTFNNMSVCNDTVTYKNIYESILVAYFIWSLPGKSEVFRSEGVNYRFVFNVLDHVIWQVMNSLTPCFFRSLL